MSAHAKMSVDQLEIEIELEEQPGEKPARKASVRRPRVPDTSRAAYQHASSTTRTEELRADILREISASSRGPRQGATADEVHVAIALTEAQVNDYRRLMDVRRRVSDLHNTFKQIRDTGLRRTNDAGNPMIVWAPADPAGESDAPY